MNQRLQYIDVANGLLICLVILYHTPAAIVKYSYNCNQIVASIGLYTRMWYECFFMPAFFLINGFCSRFEEDRKQFYAKLLKTIVLPACIFRFITPIIFDFDVNPLRLIGIFKPNSGEWFITALVTSRIIVYESKHLINDNKIISCLMVILAIIAIILNQHINSQLSDLYYWPQGICAALFIWIGHCFRNYKISNRSLTWASVIYIAFICIINVLGAHRPVMVVNLSVGGFEFPLFILLAVAGTGLVVWVSKYIKSKFLEYYGRNSLIVYLTQWAALVSLSKLFSRFIDIQTIGGSISMFAIIYILTNCICWIFIKCLDNKYGKYIVGKF